MEDLILISITTLITILFLSIIILMAILFITFLLKAIKNEFKEEIDKKIFKE